jgi:hypothetical protein
LAGLRRGFKAWCEKAAAGYRRDLGLRRDHRLDPFVLASHLRVLVITPGQLSDLNPAALQRLVETDCDSWSAVTLIQNGRKLVILNSSHSQARQNSDLSHELAHIILEHKPTQAFFGPNGTLMMKEFNREQEQEAECLSSVLLVPRDALVALLPRSDEAALAAHLGVSLEMLKMRRSVTGVDRQLGRRW